MSWLLYIQCCHEHCMQLSFKIMVFSESMPRNGIAGSYGIGAVAARAQEGLEKLSHIEGQEGQR